MITNLLKGFGHIFSGLKIISQPGIRRYVAIPLGINVLLFGGATWYLFTMFDEWMSSLMPNLPDLPGWLSWLDTLYGWFETAIVWLLWPLFAIMVVLIIFYTFTFVANLIAAPFNSILASKVENLLRDRPIEDGPEFPGFELFKRTLASEAGKLFYFIKWWLVLFLLTLIPVVNIAAPFIWIVFGAWMLSLEYLDYPMSNHNKFFKDINKQAINKRSLSLGFGGGVMLFTSVPILNLIAMPAGVAAATALWVKHGEEIS